MSRTTRTVRWLGRTLRDSGVTILAAAIVAYVAFVGTLTYIDIRPTTFSVVQVETWEHGWPWVFLERHVVQGTRESIAPWSFSAGWLSLNLLALAGVAFATHFVNACAIRPFFARRWRLANLFALLAVLALPLAYIGNLLTVTRNWQEMFDRLAQYDVDAIISYRPPLWYRRLVRAHFGSSNDDFIQDGYGVIDSIILKDARCNLEAVQQLVGQLPHLTSIQFASTGFNDQNVAWIFGIPQRDRITGVSFGATDVTDETLKRMHELTSLEFLGLDDTRVSDEGAKHLARCKSLKEVYLSLTFATDAARQYLPDGCTLKLHTYDWE